VISYIQVFVQSFCRHSLSSAHVPHAPLIWSSSVCSSYV